MKEFFPLSAFDGINWSSNNRRWWNRKGQQSLKVEELDAGPSLNSPGLLSLTDSPTPEEKPFFKKKLLDLEKAAAAPSGRQTSCWVEKRGDAQKPQGLICKNMQPWLCRGTSPQFIQALLICFYYRLEETRGGGGCTCDLQKWAHTQTAPTTQQVRARTTSLFLPPYMLTSTSHADIESGFTRSDQESHVFVAGTWRICCRTATEL